MNVKKISLCFLLVMMILLQGCGDSEEVKRIKSMSSETLQARVERAIKNNDLVFMKSVVDAGVQLNSLTVDYLPLPHFSADHATTEMLTLLFDNGMDLNYEDDRGTSLARVVDRRSIDVLKFYIDKGADVNKVSPDRESPLAVAINTRNFEAMKFLIANGADIDGGNGYPTMCIAAGIDVGYEADAAEAIRILNKNGAKVDADCGFRNFTPLLMAVNSSNRNIANYLSALGANRYRTDTKTGLTAERLARRRGFRLK